MQLIQIEHHPSRKQLITFGICWLVFFAAAGFVIQARGVSGILLMAVWGVAIAFPLMGIFIPEVLRWCFIIMSYLTYPIGFVLSWFILGFIYYLVLTPVGLLMRFFRYDPLQKQFDRESLSYWTKKEKVTDMKRYFRQF